MIRAFQVMFDGSDPVGRRARKIRLAQIARELRLMGETSAFSRMAATKSD